MHRRLGRFPGCGVKFQTRSASTVSAPLTHGIGLDDVIPMQAPQEDLSECSYTLRGSLVQRHVNDERYMNTQFRPSGVGTSIHDVGGLDHGSNIGRTRTYTVRTPHSGGEVDYGVHMRQRAVHSATNSWGFVVPHLMRLYMYIQSTPGESLRRTKAGHALALTTGAASAATTVQRFSFDAVQRELELEVHTYMRTLDETLDTTATAPLLAQFLRLHADLKLTSPSRPSHRALLQKVAVRLEERLVNDVEAHAAEDVSARGHARATQQLQTVIDNAMSFLSLAAATATAETTDRDEEALVFLEVSTKVRRCAERLNARSLDSAVPMLDRKLNALHA